MATVDDVPELEKIYSTVNEVWERLTDLDVRSGAVGAARKLLDKLESAINYLNKGGTAWDDNERLACNAWRVAQTADDIDGGVPDVSKWHELPDHAKTPWRQAAQEFRAGQS